MADSCWGQTSHSAVWQTPGWVTRLCPRSSWERYLVELTATLLASEARERGSLYPCLTRTLGPSRGGRPAYPRPLTVTLYSSRPEV